MWEIKVLLFHQNTPVSLNDVDMDRSLVEFVFGHTIDSEHTCAHPDARIDRSTQRIGNPTVDDQAGTVGNSESRNKFSLSKYTKRHFFATPSRMGRPPAIRDEAIVGFRYNTIPGTAANRSFET